MSYKKSLLGVGGFFWILLLLFLATYITIAPSLNFALFGDDWLVIHNLKFFSGPGKTLDYTSLAGFFGPYNIPHYTILLISKIWGYYHYAYYFFAFLSRVIAAIGLAYLTTRLTKNYQAGLLSGLFLAFTASGLETTNWGPFNMPTYWAIFFLSLAILAQVISVREQNLKYYSLAIFLLIISIVSFPQRMHGAPILFPLIDLISFSQKSTKKQFRLLVLRIVVLAIVVFCLHKLNTFGSSLDMVWQLEELKKDVSTASHFVWLTLVGTFGNMIIPDQFWNLSSVNSFAVRILGGTTLFPRVRPLAGIFVLVTMVVGSLRKERRLRFVIVSMILGLIWMVYLKIVLSNSENIFNAVGHIFSVFIGGSFIIFYLSHFIVTKKRRENVIMAVFFAWPLIFVLIPWIRSHINIINSTLRYMLMPAAGFGVLFALTYAQIKKSFSKFIFLVFLLFLFGVHFYSSKHYLTELYQSRNSFIYDKLWEQFLAKIPNYKPEGKFAIFYFEGDKSLIYNVFSFGFPPKISVIYENTKNSERGESNLPVITDRFGDLEDAVYGGNFVKAFGYEPGIISYDRVYAFRIEGEKLVDIKAEVIARLND